MKHTRRKNNKTIKNNKTRKSYTSKPPFPIDVVYTWSGEKTSNDIRLGYNYELKYSLRSVYYFAPWVNKIYILMNNPKKTPSWIKENNDKIVIVDHLETFPSKKYLPNQNSNAIETTIPNIKGLSEHFIYFNDDFFLGDKAKYTDFFTPDGKALVYDNTIQKKPTLFNTTLKNKLTFKFPPNNGKMYEHIPMSRIKSLSNEFNEKYSDYIDWIRKTKKRKYEGFNICKKYNLTMPCQQIHYPIAKYMYAKKMAELNDDKHRSYYVSNCGNYLKEKLDNVKKLRPLFYCINDTEIDGTKKKEIRKILLDFFNEYYPRKPPFEK
jgi:hypothetical protein